MPNSRSPRWWKACVGRPDASADLILAADAMVYVHDMAPLLREVSARAGAGRAVRVHASKAMPGEGVMLGEGLRYAHSAASARTLIEAAGLTLSGWNRHRPATRSGAQVPGLVVVAAKGCEG